MTLNQVSVCIEKTNRRLLTKHASFSKYCYIMTMKAFSEKGSSYYAKDWQLAVAEEHLCP